MKTASEIRAAMALPNVRAMQRVIREGETDQTDGAYYRVNGRPSLTSLDRHPYHGIPTTRGARAAGAYQHLGTTWARIAERYPVDCATFEPPAQDFASVVGMEDRGALADVIAGRLEQAIAKLRPEWTSLPGAAENSARYTMDRAREVFRRYGGVLASESDTQPPAPIEERGTDYVPEQEAAMAPALMFLPAILEMIPQLIGMFGKGPNSERNAKAAQVVVDTFTKAVPGAVNTQQAVEMAQASDKVRMAAATAVLTNPVVESMMQIGPTGIQEARAANVAAMSAADRWWKLILNPVLLVTAMTLPLVYLIVIELVRYVDKVSADVIAQSIGTVIGLVLGGIMGFWMGQTYQSSQRRSTDQQSPPNN